MFKIHRAANFSRLRFNMLRNKLGEGSSISKCIHLKIRRRVGVDSLTTLEEGEFKVPIDGSIEKGVIK